MQFSASKRWSITLFLGSRGVKMEETSALLRSWLMPPEIVKNFLDNDISIEKFKDLTDAYLKELCPHIGHRMTLKTHIHELLDSIAETETTDTYLDLTGNASTASNLEDPNFSLPCLSDISNFLEGLNRVPLPEFDIKTLLQTSAHGNSVLNYYNKYRVLNAKKRTLLVDIVIKHVYTYIVNNKLTPEDYNLIAAKIVTLFPSENIASYYMKAISTSKSTSGKYIPAKGKLVDKVRNLLYVSGERHRRPQSSGNQEDEESSDQLDLALDDDVLWLNTHSDPWNEVVDKWIKTQPCRVKLNSTGIATVDEVLQKWTILRNPKGHVLIDLDFDQMFKEKSLNFHKNWQSFFAKLTSNLEIKNSTGLSLLETLGAITDEDKKIPVQMALLGYLVPPKGRLSRKIKFSSAEAIESIVVQTDSAGDIDKVIQKQKESSACRKQPVQPYVLVLGSLHNFAALYIIIDDVKYVFQSAATAFDTLFKLYHVLHVKYPQAADYLYLIIQIKVYEIKTKFDKITPHIVEILNL